MILVCIRVLLSLHVINNVGVIVNSTLPVVPNFKSGSSEYCGTHRNICLKAPGYLWGHYYYPCLLCERDALIKLYEQCNGINWTRKRKWATDSPVGEWEGVTVSDGRVFSINLRNNNLVGYLPLEIGKLKELKYLDLKSNHLYGKLLIKCIY